MEVPNSNEGTFVVIEKTGSGENDGIYNATFAIQSYAPSLNLTAVLNEKIKDAMKDITELDEICDCDLNSDYNFTNPTTKQYRYQAVFDITHY